MSKTGGQLGRTVKRCRVEWDSEVADPRDRRGRRHKHHGLLNLLVLGFASGLSTLRRIEELSADIRKAARVTLGLRRAVSDTTLFMLLSSHTVAGLRNTLVAQVKALWRGKRISNDLFPLWAATSLARRAQHEGHTPRRLQENATRSSSPHPVQRTREKPFASTPQPRYSSNSRTTNVGRPPRADDSRTKFVRALRMAL